VARVDLFPAGHAAPHDGRRIAPQRGQILGQERRRRADDVAAEAEPRCRAHGAQMGVDHVFDVDAAVQEFVGLQVGGWYASRAFASSSGSGKKTRGAQHDAGQGVEAMRQLAQILGGDLGHAVDVLRHRLQRLRHPDRRLPTGGAIACPKVLVVLV